MSKISINDIADILVSKNGLEKNEAESFVTSIFDTLQDARDRISTNLLQNPEAYGETI